MRLMTKRWASDEGFTLVEMVVALLIATVIFSAMAAAGIAGVRSSVIARQNQNAVDVLNRTLEQARSVDFASLAMVSSDLQVNDTAITTGTTPRYLVPGGVGLENVWVGATGTVNPHVVTETTADGLQYTVRTYVTVPTGYTLDTAGQPDQKRVTVVATWNSYGTVRERVISTLVTETARGLPLPRYSVTPTSPTTQTKNPGTTLTWGFQVINRGARDTFNVSASTGSWTYRVDANCNGQLDVGEDTELSNTDAAIGDARPDTGPLEPNNYPPFCVVATRAIPATEAGVSTVTFNLQSSAQPDVNGAVVSTQTYTVTVTTGSTGGGGTATPTPTGTGTVATTVCEPTPPGAGTPFGFRNGVIGTEGDTASTLVNEMTENVCLYQAASHNYSTEAGAGQGRALTTGGSDTSASAAERVGWRWNPGATRKVEAGTTYVSILVSCPVVGPNLTLYAAAGSVNVNNDNWTSRGTGSETVSCASASAWARVVIAVPVAAQFTINSTNQLEVRLWVSGGSAGQQLRLDYETADAKSFYYAKVT